MKKMVAALSSVGIQASLRFNPIGETGRQLVQLLESSHGKVIGGEAVLRIDNRYVFSSWTRSLSVEVVCTGIPSG